MLEKWSNKAKEIAGSRNAVTMILKGSYKKETQESLSEVERL